MPDATELAALVRSGVHAWSRRLQASWDDFDVQFVGPIDDGALLIRLAAQQLETASPCANRLPPIYG